MGFVDAAIVIVVVIDVATQCYRLSVLYNRHVVAAFLSRCLYFTNDYHDDKTDKKHNWWRHDSPSHLQYDMVT